MKKLRKLELVEAPMTEMDQETLDQILAGWMCNSYGPAQGCATNCGSFNGKLNCTDGSSVGNFCERYYPTNGGYIDSGIVPFT